MTYRYTVQWTTTGGPGTSTFHIAEAGSAPLQGKVDAIRAFFASIASLLPDDAQVNFPGEVIEFNVATGELQTVTAVTAPATVVGAGTTGFAAPVGARVRWTTGGIVRGRRVTGTTFIVPLLAASFDTTGNVTGASKTTLATAANTLRSAMASTLVIWSKPTTALPSSGSEHPVTGSSVPDLAAVLRSRRD
jgi:hypothetical protein